MQQSHHHRGGLGSRAEASSCRSCARELHICLPATPMLALMKMYIADDSFSISSSATCTDPRCRTVSAHQGWKGTAVKCDLMPAPGAGAEPTGRSLHRRQPRSLRAACPHFPVTQFPAAKLDYGSHRFTWFSTSILLVKQWARSLLSAVSAEAASYPPKSGAYLLGAPC